MFVPDFEEVVTSPEEWFDKAEQLKYSAEILFSFEKNRLSIKRENRADVIMDIGISVKPQAVMLFGMALEVLLKSLEVKRDMIKIINGEIKGKKRISHNILNLIQELQIQLDEKEIRYLEKVTRHIVWEGRYPTSMSKDDFTEEYTKKNINKWYNTYIGDDDYNNLKSIYSKIYTVVDAALFE